MHEITDDMKSLLDETKLGYVATVSSEGTPNLSPKGTIYALDQTHLVFADIRSPQTMKNLQNNPNLEINVVHPLSRKGYRFKGTAMILNSGEEYEKILLEYKRRNVKSKINAVVKIKINYVAEITSPLYDLGLNESQIREQWKAKYLKN